MNSHDTNWGRPAGRRPARPDTPRAVLGVLVDALAGPEALGRSPFVGLRPGRAW